MGSLGLRMLEGQNGELEGQNGWLDFELDLVLMSLLEVLVGLTWPTLSWLFGTGVNAWSLAFPTPQSVQAHHFGFGSSGILIISSSPDGLLIAQ